MRSPCIIVLVVMLLAVSTSFSFDASEYLYYSEDSMDIQKESFRLNNSDYKIITISTEKAFLSKNGALVKGNKEIYSTIYNYYKVKYYPNNTELNEVKTLLTNYNKSRNDGEKKSWAGKEEQACISALFADGRVKIYGKPVWCINESTCELNSMLVFQAYKDGVGWGSYMQALKPLKEFSYAHHSTEKIMNSSFLALDVINESNFYTSLDKIKKNIPTLKEDLTKIEKNLFRYPNLNDTVDYNSCKGKCYAICPSFALDEGSLGLLETRLGSILTKAQPFHEYRKAAAEIANNTLLRFEYKVNESKAKEYYQKFNPLSDRGNKTIDKADEVLSKIVNASFKNDVNKLKNLHTKINKSIDQRNFTNMDSNINEYKKMLDKVNKSTNEVYAVYNASITAKQNADSSVFLLDSKDLDSGSRKKVESLKNKTHDLDLVFENGLTAKEYIALEKNYSKIVNKTNVLMKEQSYNPISIASSKFRAFIRKVNTGLANTIEDAKLMTEKDKINNRTSTFAGFSFLTFVAMGSLLFLALLFALLRCRQSKTSTKVAVCVTYLASVMALVLFTGMLYLYLGKTSTESNAQEFLLDFSSKNKTAVILDLGNASYGDIKHINNCGASIVNTLRNKNITVAVYKFDSGTCYSQKNANSNNETKTAAECKESVANETSQIMLEYSSVAEKPKFETIYVNKAHMKGDAAYYKACAIQPLLK